MSREVFLNAYKDAYKERYGVEPVILRIDQFISRDIVASIGAEKASKLVKAYLTIGQDPFISYSKHSLKAFENNISAINVYAHRGGEFVTLQEYQERERELLKRVKQEKEGKGFI